jgi:hypothetical protein
MQVIKVDANCYLVEWKYRDFLRLGRDFQGGVIVRLERFDKLGAKYVRVLTDKAEEKM